MKTKTKTTMHLRVAAEGNDGGWDFIPGSDFEVSARGDWRARANKIAAETYPDVEWFIVDDNGTNIN